MCRQGLHENFFFCIVADANYGCLRRSNAKGLKAVSSLPFAVAGICTMHLLYIRGSEIGLGAAPQWFGAKTRPALRKQSTDKVF